MPCTTCNRGIVGSQACPECQGTMIVSLRNSETSVSKAKKAVKKVVKAIKKRS